MKSKALVIKTIIRYSKQANLEESIQSSVQVMMFMETNIPPGTNDNIQNSK